MGSWQKTRIWLCKNCQFPFFSPSFFCIGVKKIISMEREWMKTLYSSTKAQQTHKDWICQIQYIYILLRFKIERFVLLQLNFGGRGGKWSGWIEPQYSDYWNNKSHQKDIFHGLVMVLQPFQVERVLCLKMELMHLIKITISYSLSFNLAEIQHMHCLQRSTVILLQVWTVCKYRGFWLYCSCEEV